MEPLSKKKNSLKTCPHQKLLPQHRKCQIQRLTIAVVGRQQHEKHEPRKHAPVVTQAVEQLIAACKRHGFAQPFSRNLSLRLSLTFVAFIKLSLDIRL